MPPPDPWGHAGVSSSISESLGLRFPGAVYVLHQQHLRWTGVYRTRAARLRAPPPDATGLADHSRSERVRHQLTEQLLLVDVEPPGLEPRAHVGAVAQQEVHAVGVADQVDDLRQVDDDEPVAGSQDVERRQVA